MPSTTKRRSSRSDRGEQQEAEMQRQAETLDERQRLAAAEERADLMARSDAETNTFAEFNRAAAEEQKAEAEEHIERIRTAAGIDTGEIIYADFVVHRDDEEAIVSRIKSLESECAEAEVTLETRKLEAKHAQKVFDGKVAELRKAVRSLSEPLPLFDGQPSSNGQAEDDESWRQIDLQTLALGSRVLKLLEDAELRTMGQLADWTEHKLLVDIPGIGEAKVREIEDALENFWRVRAEEKVQSDAAQAQDAEGPIVEDEE